MRKQEYLHLHALFSELAVFLAEEDAVSTGAIVPHEDRSADPNAVHAAKSDHHEAVMALSRSLVADLPVPDAEVAQPPS